MKNARRELLSVFGALFLVSMLAASTALGATVTVGNHSFETVGTSLGGPWWSLPDPGAWVDGNGGNSYEILTVPDDTHFTAPATAPDGSNVLNLVAASPVSQNLSHAVSAGDVVTLDFFVGDSKAQTPGNVDATLTLDGSPVNTQTVSNDAPNEGFTRKSVQWTATSGGNLGIQFSNNGGGNWIDDVGVDVSTAPAIRGDVNAQLSGIVFYSQSDNNPPAPTASGFGGVSNSLPQEDDNSYGGGSSGSQTYGGSVSYADGSATSDIGSPFSWSIGGGNTATVHGGGTAGASLDLDLAGAPIGTSTEGLTNGGFGGTTYDGSDTAGIDGFIAFTVDFTIDALAAGPDVDGTFGIQVDVFSLTWGDLVPDVTPFVTGSSIDVSVDMTEETRTDELGDAWTFALTAADIADAGGSVDETFTAHFSFDLSDTGTGIGTYEPVVFTVNAFADGEAVVVPEPATLALAALGLGGLRRRRRR